MADAVLKREIAGGSLDTWKLRAAGGGDDLPTDPVSDILVRAKLDSLLTLVAGTLKVDDDQTQAKLDAVSTLLGGVLKVDDDQTQAKLDAMLTLLGGTLKVDDDQTQAALTAVQAVLSGQLVVSQYTNVEPKAVTYLAQNAGANIAYPTAPDKRVILLWASAKPDPNASNFPLIEILLGAKSCYLDYTVVHREKFTAPNLGDDIIVNLDISGKVACTFHFLEVSI